MKIPDFPNLLPSRVVGLVVEYFYLYMIWLQLSNIIPELFRLPCVKNFASNIYSPISSEMMDRFWCLRSLNNRISVFYMIGPFASGANVSLVAKNGTKKIIPILWIKSSKKPQIKKFHKTDPPKLGNLIQKTILKFSKTKN